MDPSGLTNVFISYPLNSTRKLRKEKCPADLQIVPKHIGAILDMPDVAEYLLTRFHEIITLPGDPLGSTTLVQHHIPLKPDTAPVYIPAHRFPHSQCQVLEKNSGRHVGTGCN